MTPLEMTPSDARRCFEESAEFLIDTASLVAPDQWHAPGLGQWTVRELVGHAGRALQTVTSYLASPGASADLAGPVAYFLAAFGTEGDNDAASQAILERGRDAGKALGDDPLARLRALRDEAIGALHDSDDNLIVTTPMGTIALADYLPTRTFEMVVHTLDLGRAIGVSTTPPIGPLTSTAVLAASVAVRRGHGVEACLALTGRTPLGANLPFP